jgi:hypothetical protein
MGAISSLYIRIKGDATHFESTMSGVERSLKRQGSALKRAGSNITTGLTMPIVGLVTAAANFDETWVRVVDKLNTLSPSAARELKEFGADVSAAIKSVVNWFERLSPTTQENIVKVGLMAVALGPLVHWLGAAEGVLGSFIGVANGVPVVLGAIATGLNTVTVAINTGGIIALLSKIGPYAAAALVAAGVAYGAYELISEGNKRVAAGAEEDARRLGEAAAALKGAYSEFNSALPDVQEWSKDLYAMIDLNDALWADLASAKPHNPLIDEYKSMYGDLSKMGKEAMASLREGAGIGRGLADTHMVADSLVKVDELSEGLGNKVVRELTEMEVGFKALTINGIDSTADALADLAMGGEVNFHDFATSLMRDMIALTIKAQILAPLLRSLGFDVGVSGGQLVDNSPTTATLPDYASDFIGPIPQSQGYGLNSSGTSGSARVVINNYGNPIEGDVSAQVGMGADGEQVIHMTILGHVKRAMRSGALAPEMALYGGRRVGAV